MTVPKKLAGKVAVVTGGSKGYGNGIAAKLRENGAEVWITGRNEQALKMAAAETDCHFMTADICSETDWKRLIDIVMAEHGHIDILVNNAGGGGKIAECSEQSPESIRETIAINLTGNILGCSLTAEIMKNQKSGTIINISSVCAREAWAGWGVYSAAKAGLIQFSKSLYLELRPFGVRVTSLIPSWGATSFNSNANIPSFDKETAEKCIQPKEIGEQVLNICMLPSHLCILDVTLLPLVQEINPL